MKKCWKVMCRESFFTSLGLLQRFLALYTWEENHFPFAIHHQDLSQRWCWPAGGMAEGGPQGPLLCTQSTALAAACEEPPGVFFSLPGYSKQFLMTMGAQHMPSTNTWVGKGQNPTHEEGRRWGGTLTALQGLGEVSPALAGARGKKNNMSGDGREERTWFEDHAATRRNWSQGRTRWVMV